MWGYAWLQVIPQSSMEHAQDNQLTVLWQTLSSFRFAPTVLVITTVLIGHPGTSGLVFISVVMTVVDILGYKHTHIHAN